MSDLSLTHATVPTTPYTDQIPGTSGLRKKTRTFMQPNYLENFAQAVFDAVLDVELFPNKEYQASSSSTSSGSHNIDNLIISGDGRFWSDVAIAKLMSVAFANGVKKVVIGRYGYLSTPAVSAVIREKMSISVPSGGEKKMSSAGTGVDSVSNADGAIFGAFNLTASHNPGGIDDDFGIKYSGPNGGQDDGLYKAVIEKARNITRVKKIPVLEKILTENDCTEMRKILHADVNSVFPFGKWHKCEIIDPTLSHHTLLKQIFDFDLIRKLVKHEKFSCVFDCMSGVSGPYAQKILCEDLGVPLENVMNSQPLPDFGGKGSNHHGHADPNLCHAWDIVGRMGLDKNGGTLVEESGTRYFTFGAAWDGDGDRNMILGEKCFVCPSDSLAMIVENCEECIPLYRDANNKIKACARSMPTSRALDVVCKRKNIECFETPTGWKYFANFMDSGNVTATNPKLKQPGMKVYTPFICGEEAFGTASDHAREKDGMWAVLCWLSILAWKNREVLLDHHDHSTSVNNNSKSEGENRELVSVKDVCMSHWRKYGRHYYVRWDYEEVDKAQAELFMSDMKGRILGSENGLKGQKIDIISNCNANGGPDSAIESKMFTIDFADVFSYTDPIDGSKTENQGIRIFFTNGCRAVYRLSGTGVVGATIRCYLEKYVEYEEANATDHGTSLTGLDNNHLAEVEGFGLGVEKFVGVCRYVGLVTLKT